MYLFIVCALFNAAGFVYFYLQYKNIKEKYWFRVDEAREDAESKYKKEIVSLRQLNKIMAKRIQELEDPSAIHISNADTGTYVGTLKGPSYE